MRSQLSKIGKLLFLTLLLYGSIVAAIAIPTHHENKQPNEIKSGLIFQKKSAVNFPRAGVPLRPPKVPKPGSPRPGDSPSGPPPHLTPNDPVEPGPPPHLTPGDSVDAPAPPVRLDTPNLDKPSGPVDVTPINPGPKPDPSKPIPSEAEIMAQCNVPKDKAIFWSGTQDKVYGFKDQMQLTTDEMAFPPDYVRSFSGPDRKVAGNPKSLEFAHKYSKAFATKAEGEVHVMVPWDTGPNPSRVFHTSEWPALKEGLQTGRITKVIQVNPNNYAETRIYDPTIYGLTKRAAVVDLNNVPWDVNLDALAEAWRRSQIAV